MAAETGELEVVQVTDKGLMHDFVLDYCQKLGWVPGKMDDVLNWVAGGEGAGVYVGKLNGRPITGVAMIQHNKSYAWIGIYYCEEEYRGKGYAFKTWKVARASLCPDSNVCLDAVVSASSLYESQGFQRSWITTFYYFSVSNILEVYKDLAMPANVTIISTTSVDFKKLKTYVEDIIGFTFDRDDLLEKLIALPTHIALVAVNENGDIVGFATIRESVTLDKTGYRLAPLLADSGDIARHLLLKLAKEVDPEQKFAIYLTSSTNDVAESIRHEVNGTKYIDLVRMYTKREEPMKKAKYFGLFSPELAG